MRPIVKEQINGRTLPLIMAHKGGTAYGRENSLETIRKALEIMPDVIIEVDVRKSRDGVLYCHHGSVPFGVAAAAFFGYLSFAQIQKLIGQRDMLSAIFKAIPETAIIYLDIKDRSVTAEDLKQVIGAHRRVWIAPLTTAKHLKELRSVLGEEYAYAYNRPVLFPRRMMRKLGSQTDFLQSFWWNWNKDIVAEIEGHGAVYHLCQWFISTPRYVTYLNRSRYRGLFFSIYDLAEARQLSAKSDTLQQ